MDMNFINEDIPRISSLIIKEILNKKANKAVILALFGELGSGKTTLTQEIAKQLGVKDNINSPTYVIMKIYDVNKNSLYYDFFKKIIHIDAYRLESSLELLKIGWEEIQKDENNLIIIEWPEKVEDIIPEDIIKIKLSHIDEGTRNIVVKTD
jgi:tRNA threonylcarbamoyladenosine biosynthesis protein TsaE